jgi:glycosyltransferase involved in cell wall biosynthesis
LPAVPFDSLFSVAAEADIGLFLNESRSRHHKVLAPNKLYEYLMSGLMVMAGPGGDFAHVIGDTEAGVYLESSDPAEVAPRLEALSAEDIDRYRRKALAAAQDYAWEREREKLVSLYRDL